MLRRILFIFFVFTIAAASSAAEKLTPSPFHSKLGSEIDAAENRTYNIFGEIPGFTLAKLYRKSSQTFRLNILLQNDKGADVFIIDLPSLRQKKLLRDLALRVESLDEGATKPALALKLPDQTGNMSVRLFDGSEFHGRIAGIANNRLTFKTASGVEFELSDDQISSISRSSHIPASTNFSRIDPAGSRLLFAPTGRKMKPGEGYFADYMLFFPTIGYGLSSNFSVSGGMSIIPGISLGSQLVYVAPRLAFDISKNASAATGVLYLNIPDGTDDLMLTYAVATIGDRSKALTFGAAMPILDEVEVNRPVFLLGGELQVSNSIKLITENWIFTGLENDAAAAISAGVRFFGKKIAVDFSLITFDEALGSGGWPFFPWIDFSVGFGRR